MLNHSEKLDAIVPALLAWAKTAEDPTKDKKGQVGKNTNYKYAGLDDFLPELRESLATHGLVVMQGAMALGEGYVKTTTILHTSGQYITTGYPLVTNSDPQKQGSADTYARRYGILSALNLVPQADDDGAGHNRPDRKKEDPDTKAARQATHDKEWEKDRPRFMQAFANLGWDGAKYDDLCNFLEEKGLERPSTIGNERRRKLIAALSEGGLGPQFDQWWDAKTGGGEGEGDPDPNDENIRDYR